MKIYVLVEKAERGPYTKSEVFALMKEGSISADALGRWENESDWKPINKVLAGGSLRLFSVEEIAQKQEELPESTVFVEDLLPPHREVEAAPSPKSRKAHVLGFIAVALAIGSGLFLFHAGTSDSVDHPTLADQPPQPSENVATPPPSAPQRIARATPMPRVSTSPSNDGPSVSKNTPIPDARNQNEDTADKPPVLAEALPQAPPQNVHPLPAVVSKPAEQAIFHPTTNAIQLGVTRDITDVQFWVSRPVETPRGVLVLCMSRNGNAEAAAKAAVWLDFAKNQSLALVTIKFTSPKELVSMKRGYLYAEKESAQILFDGLNRTGLSGLPLLVYGWGEGGTFVSSLTNVAGNRIRSWAVFTGLLLVQPQRGDGRPALIACDDEITKINPELAKVFETGRDKDLKWTWLSMASSVKDRAKQFEDFTRAYFAATLAGNNPRDGIWVGTDTMEKLSFGDISTSPKSTAWLPDESLLSTWKQLMPTPEQQKTPTVIQKTLETRVKGQPEITMLLRLPSHYSKEHSIKGTLAFCTWEGNAETIRKELLYRTDMKVVAAGPAGIAARLIQYAEKNNMAVVSWTTKQVWTRKGSTDELNQQEEREFDRNFDKLANVWENGLTALARENNVPDRELLLYGISRGAQWAHRLALRKPERFLAVHVHIPSTFDTPTGKASKVLWLVTTGELESGYERASRFYQQCRKLNYPIIFKAIMDLGHSDSSIAENLGFRFFDYALAIRDKRNELAASQTNALLRKEAHDAAVWEKDFHQPPFVGDFLNQDIFSLKEANLIPAALQVPLPTDGIAQAWNK